MKRLLAIAVVLMLLAALHASRPVTLPLVAGCMIAALSWPLLRRLEKRIPPWAALLLTILAVTSVIVALVAALGWSATTIGRDLQQQSDRIASLQSQISAFTERFGVTLPEFGSGAEQIGKTENGEKGATHGLATAIAGVLFTTFGYLALSMGFAALALAERRDAAEKIRIRFPKQKADTLIGISAKIGTAARQYFRAKSITSVIAGVMTGVIALAFGLKFALIWALLAFLLEYIPTIGSLLSVVPPVIYAFVQFNGFGQPLGMLAALTVAQLFLGNYIDPRLEGRLLNVSPLVVLFSIVFWGWLWGPAGALLGVPITVAITIVTRQFEETRWIWALLSDPADKHDD
ncbi:MAG: AI-2E family transporter [Gemmatimonadaceae bacterium]